MKITFTVPTVSWATNVHWSVNFLHQLWLQLNKKIILFLVLYKLHLRIISFYLSRHSVGSCRNLVDVCSVLLTSVQKTHWHCVMVVICSRGNSPRHSLHETRGSTASSHVGRYRAVVIFTATELKKHTRKTQRGKNVSWDKTSNNPADDKRKYLKWEHIWLSFVCVIHSISRV